MHEETFEQIVPIRLAVIGQLGAVKEPKGTEKGYFPCRKRWTF